jgi:integrase
MTASSTVASNSKIDAKLLKRLEGTKAAKAAVWYYEPSADRSGTFALKHTAAGGLIWYFIYGVERRTYRLGAYPAMTLTAARDELKVAKSKLGLGTDPAAERRSQKAMKSLADIWAMYQQTDRYLRLSRSRHQNFTTTLAHYQNQPVWTMPVDGITPRLAQEAVSRAGRSAYTASYGGRQIMVQLWEWAADMEEIPNLRCPFAKVETLPPRKRSNHVLSDEQIGRFVGWLDRFWTKPQTLQRRQAALALELMLYSGKRRNEIKNLRCDHIKPGSAWIADKVHGGARFVLTERHQQIINRAKLLRGSADSPWLFPALHTEREESVAINDLFELAREVCDLYYDEPTRDGITRHALAPHCLRRTFGSVAARRKLGISSDIQRALLDHVGKDVHAQIYQGGLDDELRAAATLVADEIEAIGRVTAMAA